MERHRRGDQPGDRVMGPLGGLGGLGAYARLVAVNEAKLALTPAALNDVEAAALPVMLLTAWQALRAASELRIGQRVLIHVWFMMADFSR